MHAYVIMLKCIPFIYKQVLHTQCKCIWDRVNLKVCSVCLHMWNVGNFYFPFIMGKMQVRFQRLTMFDIPTFLVLFEM